MDNLILDKKAGVFRAGNMDFGCGALSGRLVFSESGNTSLATVYADGMPIGTAALSPAGPVDSLSLRLLTLAPLAGVVVDATGGFGWAVAAAGLFGLAAYAALLALPADAPTA